MTNRQMDELKTFFKTEMHQAITASEKRLEARLEARLGARIDALEAKMDDGFRGVGEALDTIMGIIERDRKVTNQRLTRLERHVFGV